MTTYLTPASDLRIVVKLTKRLPIKPKDDLLTRDLFAVYNENDVSKDYSDKRFTTKMIATKTDLVLAKGSWWPNGPIVSSLSFKNILQFSAMPGRPAKLLLLIKNDDGTKTELIVMKTKGQTFANQLLICLQRNVNLTQQNLLRNSNGTNNREPRPVSYQMEVVSTENFSRKVPANNSSKRRPAPAPPVELVREHQKQKQLDQLITPHRVESLRPPPSEPNRRLKERTRHPSDNQEEAYSRTTYDPETKVETLDSVVVYGQRSDKPPKPLNPNMKTRKLRSRPQRELSSLNGGHKVSREYDDNNTPWEVNICYIKHDPLVGCVEDESGPIYMYTAHQLVNQDHRDYGDYNSDEDDGASFSGDIDDSDSTDSQDSRDENRELERFLMLGGSENVASNGINGTGGKISEVYEY